jgi:hypothetical protein
MQLQGAIRALNRLARRFGSKTGKPETAEWRLSPYPSGKSFAFTLIHDADSGYSRRLAPLMDALEELGFRITVTVFPFWAEWRATTRHPSGGNG